MTQEPFDQEQGHPRDTSGRFIKFDLLMPRARGSRDVAGKVYDQVSELMKVVRKGS